MEKKNPIGEWQHKRLNLTDDTIKDIYSNTLKFKDCLGDASIGANSAPTYFFTIWKDSKIINTFAAYGISAPWFKESEDSSKRELHKFYDSVFNLTKKK